MVEVHITYTGKSYSPRDNWCIINEGTERFSNIAAAKQWLKDRYGNCKRVPMYCDTKDGTKQTGWIYSYRADDISHVPIAKWLARDWCELRECNPLDVAQKAIAV